MLYVGLKHLHTTVATLSVVLFVLRGGWIMVGSAMQRRRWVRVAPHIINTLLLATGFAVAWLGWRYPIELHGWITAKIIALVVYIGLGVMAFKAGRPAPVRFLAFFAALAVYAYIVMVALYKTPLPL